MHDALVAHRSARDVLAAETDRRNDLAIALDMAKLRYDAGRTSYLEVLDAQRTLLAAETLRIGAARDARLAIVDFAKSLGGGWAPESYLPNERRAAPARYHGRSVSFGIADRSGESAIRAAPIHSQERGMARFGSGVAMASLALFAAATACAQQQVVVVQGALCRGEEPFWQLEASRTTAVLNRLATKGNREVIFHGAPQAFMYLTPAGIVWRGDSTHLPRETLVVTLREEACRSTMADGPPLPWRAMLSLKAGEALTGCCTVLAGYDVKAAPVANFAEKDAG